MLLAAGILRELPRSFLRKQDSSSAFTVILLTSMGTPTGNRLKGSLLLAEVVQLNLRSAFFWDLEGESLSSLCLPKVPYFPLWFECTAEFPPCQMHLRFPGSRPIFFRLSFFSRAVWPRRVSIGISDFRPPSRSCETDHAKIRAYKQLLELHYRWIYEHGRSNSLRLTSDNRLGAKTVFRPLGATCITLFRNVQFLRDKKALTLIERTLRYGNDVTGSIFGSFDLHSNQRVFPSIHPCGKLTRDGSSVISIHESLWCLTGVHCLCFFFSFFVVFGTKCKGSPFVKISELFRSEMQVFASCTSLLLCPIRARPGKSFFLVLTPFMPGAQRRRWVGIVSASLESIILVIPFVVDGSPLLRTPDEYPPNVLSSQFRFLVPLCDVGKNGFGLHWREIMHETTENGTSMIAPRFSWRQRTGDWCIRGRDSSCLILMDIIYVGSCWSRNR